MKNEIALFQGFLDFILLTDRDFEKSDNPRRSDIDHPHRFH